MALSVSGFPSTIRAAGPNADPPSKRCRRRTNSHRSERSVSSTWLSSPLSDQLSPRNFIPAYVYAMSRVVEDVEPVDPADVPAPPSPSSAARPTISVDTSGLQQQQPPSRVLISATAVKARAPSPHKSGISLRYQSLAIVDPSQQGD